MASLTRGGPPQILRQKGDEWKQKYLAECGGGKKPRPPNKRYGHAEVRTELRRMSYGKCFYCERGIPEGEDEVDHYIEVEERRDLAFSWENLYLACRGCNSKKADNRRSPVIACVDPCKSDQKPADHLSFKAEQIVPRDECGRQTIAKCQLNRDDLDLQRMRLLRQFDQTVKEIQARMIKDGRKGMTDEEREILRCYCDRTQPFSLMMAVCLAHEGV